MLFRESSKILNVLPLLLIVGFGLATYSGSVAVSDSQIFGSDTVITISRALAGLYPELYPRDFLFSSSTNYNFYNNANVGFFQLAEIFHISSLQEAYRILDGVVTSIFLLGYYLLGCKVIDNRLAALIFALSCAVPISTLGGDYWGLYGEPQARLVFSAVLPFCLLFGLHDRQRPADWFAMFLCLGLALWVHPASGPPVALSLMIAMIAKTFRHVNRNEIIVCSLASGLLFLIIGGPNLWQYYSIVSKASVGANPVLAEQAIRATYSPEYVDGAEGLASGMSHIFSGSRLSLAIFGFCGLCAVFIANHRRDRSNIIFIVTALVWIFVLAGCVPTVENELSRLMGRPPMQFDLIRSIRYVIPLLLLLAFWGIARLPVPAAVQSLLLVSIGVFWFHARLAPPSPDYLEDQNPMRGIECWESGHLICPRPADTDTEEMLNFVRANTADSALFFSPGSGLAIRSFARRPLAFEIKDAGWLAYSNHKKLIENTGLIENYKAIATQTQNSTTNAAWLKFAELTGTDYVVLSGPIDRKNIPRTTSLVYQNKSFSIFCRAKSSALLQTDRIESQWPISATNMTAPLSKSHY